jgi:hypothetical protein
MSDRAYVERRAVQEAQLASAATNVRAAAAHDVMAATYYRELARLAQVEEQRLVHRRPRLL